MANTQLHMLCGQIASGKSTLAANLAAAPNTIRISEDEWLAGLFADQMVSLADYVRCSAKLRTVMGPHVVSLLRTGLSVVLDFPANTLEQRAWMRDLFVAADAGHTLHYLEVPDAICKARLQERNAAGDHPFAATDAQFAQVAKHFVAPTPEEGFNVKLHHPKQE